MAPVNLKDIFDAIERRRRLGPPPILVATGILLTALLLLAYNIAFIYLVATHARGGSP